MKGWSAILVIIGIAATAYAFLMKTTVPADAEAIAVSPALAGGISNVALMQQQMMILHVGLMLLLTGSLFYIAAEIFDAATSYEDENE